MFCLSLSFKFLFCVIGGEYEYVARTYKDSPALLLKVKHTMILSAVPEIVLSMKIQVHISFLMISHSTVFTADRTRGESSEGKCT